MPQKQSSWTIPPQKPPHYSRIPNHTPLTMYNQVGAHNRLVWDNDLNRRRCTADAKHTGKRCQRPPIPGGTVCNVHGGSTKSARRKGQLNLMEMLDPANARIAKMIVDPNTKNQDLIRIWENLLDRLGFPRNMEVSMEDVRDQVLDAISEVDEDEVGEIEAEIVEENGEEKE